jgi:Uma2 family endonuclease
MAQALQAPVDLFDYLAFDERSALRHEYVGGRVRQRESSSMRHNRIGCNIAMALMQRLAGSNSQVFINDVRLHVRAAGSVYYPDVFVHAGSAIADARTLLDDATLVVEVTSESTASIDRREKLAAYSKLPGLRSYWIVSQDEQRVEVHTRAEDGHWSAMACTTGDDLLAAPGVPGTPLALAGLYADTDVA